MPEQTHIPHILWAQQRETVLLTVAVPDIEKVDVKFEENSVSFNGQTTSVKEKNTYAVKIDLYEKIDPEACKYENIGQKYWRLLLKKKDTTVAFWPRVTKEKTRLHWLQTDFDHWKDEDESDDEKPGFGGNFQDMFSGGMGGMGGMEGMGGMGGMGDMPDMGEDSDDDDGGVDDLEAPAATTENGVNGKNHQEEKKSDNKQDDEEKSAEKTKAGVEESASK
ncbi:unnamed protein product [Rotaria socialis]|uniref:CS domain-containing protein n=1 Tax=Rotaria socialis TaxID=392032 RepID=A0A817S215_9BILA|nr:unnamed protein product [Rotaria socialis]CAF3586451.1 unnamed protein product [Rotaria socialis]CAF4331320.1 unnamed protein product [Rotaria socialis]CAF4520021.1 unnamed protein product [Rotaria socialis]